MGTPGAACPSTFARFMAIPAVAASDDVTPPFASRYRGQTLKWRTMCTKAFAAKLLISKFVIWFDVSDFHELIESSVTRSRLVITSTSLPSWRSVDARAIMSCSTGESRSIVRMSGYFWSSTNRAGTSTVRVVKLPPNLWVND